MVDREEKIFTVQGVGNPVPAELLSEQAGSTPSRSSDRNASTVGNLAVVADRTTSFTTTPVANFNPFEQRSRLPRSPKSSPVSREHERTTPTSDTQDSDALNRLGKKIDVLWDYIKTRNNVHHEIKRLVTSIKNLYVEHAQQVGQPNDEVETTQAISKMAKQITVCCETQTSPIISNQSTNEKETVLRDSEMTTNSKRRKSKQDSPPGHLQKKGKQRAGETQSVGATSLNASSSKDEPKKPDNVKDSDWQLVRGKKRKPRERIPHHRPDAIKITKTGAMSYADMLKKMKEDPSLNDISGKVTRICRTGKGDLLLELEKDVHPKELGFQSAIENSLGSDAQIQTLTQTDEVLVEIKDIDEATTKEEVHKAITSKFEDAKDLPIICIKSLRAAYRGTQTAVVAVPSSTAKVMKNEGKVRIGWVSCRIREKTLPLRCFKCWKYGHMAKLCRSDVDRSGLCYKCGGGGHKVKECKEEADCMLCQQRTNHNHIAGSGRCAAYMVALKKARR